MSKNELAKNSKFRDIASIMKDPKAKAKLSNLVDEAVVCKGAISMQQENIKVLRETAKDDLGMCPKLFSVFVSSAFNNDYQQRKDSLDEQVTLLEHLMGDSGTLTHTPSDTSNDE